MTLEDLGRILEANGVSLSGTHLSQLAKYAELLKAKNEYINLISRKDEENILSNHILHSLTVTLPALTLPGIAKGANVFDLGTGGGLPGIPVKIVRDDLSLTLCDSIMKKIASVREFCSALGISAKVICDRAEHLAKLKDYTNAYDAVITRAVAPLDDLAKWSKGLLKKKGVLLALKGGELSEEIKRTSRLNFIQSVDAASLDLIGYDEFAKEEKKLVRVVVA